MIVRDTLKMMILEWTPGCTTMYDGHLTAFGVFYLGESKSNVTDIVDVKAARPTESTSEHAQDLLCRIVPIVPLRGGL